MDSEDNVRIVIRRRHVLKDTLHKMRSGTLNFTKHFRVTFIGEAAVDAGGPMREYLHILVASIVQNNSLFCGSENLRVPMHSVLELERQTFYHIGSILALSLVHGGPAPAFFTPAIADYFVYGVQKIKATVDDVPDDQVKQKLTKVRNIGCGNSQDLSPQIDHNE